MNRKYGTAARAVVLGSAVALTGAYGAQAHGVPPHGAPRFPSIQGTLTAAGSGSIQVEAPGGSITVPIASSTAVLRVVTGSVADLKVGQRVSVRLSSAGGTVESVVIEQKLPPRPKHDREPAQHGNGGRPPEPKPTAAPAPQHGTAHPAPTQFDSQVAGVTGSTVTLRDSHGKTSAYAFSSNLSVKKYMNGTLSDLAAGETVHVDRAPSGVASLIVILQA